MMKMKKLRLRKVVTLDKVPQVVRGESKTWNSELLSNTALAMPPQVGL